MADATIIGAGVAGLWAARALLAHGIRPRLVDRVGTPGAHGCSWWAGGMLAPNCEGALAEEPVIRHGQEAAEAWAAVTEVITRGSLVLAPARDRADLTAFARRTGGHETLDASGIAMLEPDLDRRHDTTLFFAGEAHLDPRRALADLTAQLAEDGVEIERADLDPATVKGPVLDCRGMAARAALPALRAVRGEMVVLRSTEITLTRPVRLLHSRHPLYVVPRAGGLFMLGATQVESAHQGGVTARAALELMSTAYALDPRFAEAEIVELGADLRPAFADNVPRVMQRGNVLHLNGLFRHGYLMAPALARQAARYLATAEKGDLFHED